MSISIQTTVTITNEQIVSVLHSAFYSGIAYWATFEEYNSPEAIMDGESAEISVSDDDDQDAVLHTITRDKIVDGLQRMATEYPRHFADIMNDRTDADTGDVLLQLAIFQDVIYG